MPIQILNFLWLIYMSLTFTSSVRYSISDFCWIFLQLLSCDLIFLSSSYYIYLDCRSNYIIVHFCSCVLFHVQQYGLVQNSRKEHDHSSRLNHLQFETASLMSDGHTRLPLYEVPMRSCSHYVIRDSLITIHSVICYI